MWMLERYYDELTQLHPDRSRITPVNITAAAEWFFVGTPKDKWDIKDDFPVVTPPFPEMWMEFIPPKYINVDGRREAWPVAIQAAGCMVSCVNVPPEEATSVIRDDIAREAIARNGVFDGTSPNVMEDKIRRVLDRGCEAAWIVKWELWVKYLHHVTQGPGLIAYVEPDGHIIPELLILMANDESFVGLHLEQNFWPFLFATSLMHAKNVSVIDDPLPPAILKRRAKDGKPAITFKTLKIDSMRKQAKRETEDRQQSEAKRAMHIVRGHFKDYRESGLFGKNKGLYWWDMHVAGDESAGRVIKDYKL